MLELSETVKTHFGSQFGSKLGVTRMDDVIDETQDKYSHVERKMPVIFRTRFERRGNTRQKFSAMFQ